MRVVLDTNVVLDLWLFGDVRSAPLRQALAVGRLTPLTLQGDGGLTSRTTQAFGFRYNIKHPLTRRTKIDLLRDLDIA